MGRDRGRRLRDRRGHALTRVTYGPTGYEFSPCPHGADAADCHCRASRDHDRILCDTVEGAGAGLSQSSSSRARSRSRRPSVRPPGDHGPHARGRRRRAQRRRRSRQHHGHQLWPAGRVRHERQQDGVPRGGTYGPGVRRRVRGGCRRVADHSSILCRTAPGIGGPALPLYWSVKVEGRTSDLLGRLDQLRAPRTSRASRRRPPRPPEAR